MITLYADPDCDACRRLRDTLADARLAHRYEAVGPSRPDHPPHTLVESGQTVTGHEAMARRIEEVGRQRGLSTHYASDACHQYDDDPDVCVG